MKLKALLKKKRKGFANTVTNVGVAIVITFVVLYIITIVAEMTKIDSTSDFYPIYKMLVEKSYTIFSIFFFVPTTCILVISYIRKKMSPVDSAGETTAV